MKELNELDLIQACSGLDKYGHPKCMFNLSWENWYHFYDANEKDELEIEILPKAVLDPLFIDKPEIRIFKHKGFTQVDFIYFSSNDLDLYAHHKYLADFEEPANSVSYSEEELKTGCYVDEEGLQPIFFPTMVLNIIPHEYKDKYVMIGTNPIISCLMPVKPGEEYRMLRMVFGNGDVLLGESGFAFFETSSNEGEEVIDQTASVGEEFTEGGQTPIPDMDNVEKGLDGEVPAGSAE